MKIPDTMQYIETVTEASTGTMVMAEGPVPHVRDNELLIRVMAAGVNRPDIAQRKGAYPPPPGASNILGLEAAGEVVATGPQTRNFKCGDLVCALTNGGAYANYCTAPETQCLPWPKKYTAIMAAALPETYFTVWTNVFQRGRLAKNETLLVHGGSSGIGTTAIQLAHEFAGKVYATAGSQEKCRACLSFGAAAAINYREDDFVTHIQQLTQDKGVDMILDMVGAAYFSRNLQCLATHGRLIEISTQQGATVDQFDLRKLMSNCLTVMGSTLRPRTTLEKAAIAASLKKNVWPVLDQGHCGPIIDKVFPFTEVQAAHRLMESSQHIGKIILSMV